MVRGQNWRAANEGSNGGGADHKRPDKNADNFSITISPNSLRSGAESIKSRILSRLPAGKQSELLNLAEKRLVAGNKIVMLQGRPGQHMFVIRKGQMQISRREQKGTENVIGILGPGDSFGERALLMRKPYSETALTLTDLCEIAAINREQLDAFVAQYPSLQRTIDAYCRSLNRGEPKSRMMNRRR